MVSETPGIGGHINPYLTTADNEKDPDASGLNRLNIYQRPRTANSSRRNNYHGRSNVNGFR